MVERYTSQGKVNEAQAKSSLEYWQAKLNRELDDWETQKETLERQLNEANSSSLSLGGQLERAEAESKSLHERLRKAEESAESSERIWHKISGEYEKLEKDWKQLVEQSKTAAGLETLISKLETDETEKFEKIYTRTKVGSQSGLMPFHGLGLGQLAAASEGSQSRSMPYRRLGGLIQHEGAEENDE
ncbi:hypothetical protein FCL40_01995 [Ferrimonas sediminicola]|uniref:Uncharacterized protein n=1 Tax=Ferrimonas sediminicola TaxID=2569538 RepID=A0A4U1BJ16_9GAMM|nr:hypothetical protein [Ferrimonas sediminicola]TKB51353.1 hypothetical protein FCL40_01995 [Ferrimonas sediminicola]